MIKIISNNGWNFHNAKELTVRIDEKNITTMPDGSRAYIISKAQARRIDKHFCSSGKPFCTCGSSPVFEYEENEYCVGESNFI